MSTFNYCPVIWMFCGKVANEKLNALHKRALQALYNDFESSFQELLHKGNHHTIHEMNKRRLLLEVFKCINREAPPFLHDIFKVNKIKYNLRITNTLSLPETSTKTWGLHSFSYRGSRSWNSLSDDIKCVTSSKLFKNKLQNIGEIQCSCKLCIIE